jgi:hypothetical protein
MEERGEMAQVEMRRAQEACGCGKIIETPVGKF